MILVRRLAEQEHCISATMKFGAGADGDPSVKVKDLITDLISRLQAEASSEKREDLEADVAKHSSKLEAAVARSIDGEISTQQVANTHVQHVVNTVEVEMPKIIKETVQRKRPIIQEKINQVTKHIKIPQVQFLTKVDDIPVVVQRQVSTAQTVQKAMEVPPLQFTDKGNDIPVEAQRQISMVRTIQKTTDIHSCSVMIMWLMSLLRWPCKLHMCTSWRRQPRPYSCRWSRKFQRQPKSHRCRPSRKLVRPHRPR